MTSAIEMDLAHLRDQRTRANLVGRSRIRSAARSSLEEQGFLEVDTPALGERVDEYPAGHLGVSLADGTNLWLVQSPQVYKQALIATGTERYFQFAHCFRDNDREPGRTDYLREFIQLDVEMEATSVDELIAVVEHLVHRIFADLAMPLLPSPFARISADEALSRHGSDKPDLRDGVNETSCLWVVDFPLATSEPSGPVLERHPMAMPHVTPASADDLVVGHSHSFDLVINGYEIASGDLRIHDPAMQRAVLDAAGLDPSAFADLLLVLEDCPPHGGFGLGIDRIAMQLLGTDSVAAVTGFPAGFGY